MNRIYVVGLGPGDEKMMTGQALDALDDADDGIEHEVMSAKDNQKQQQDTVDDAHPEGRPVWSNAVGDKSDNDSADSRADTKCGYEPCAL